MKIFLLWLFLVISGFGEKIITSSLAQPPEENLDSSAFKTVRVELLNKISAKRTTLQIPIGSSHVVQDIRLAPQACHLDHDSYRGTTYRVPFKVYLEQENQGTGKTRNKIEEPLEAIEFYTGELSSNPRDPQHPIEHSIYDVIIKGCD